jgi:hypothetical protein
MKSGPASSRRWRRKLAIYALSFVIVGAPWVNHHQLLAVVRRATPQLMWMNLPLLWPWPRPAIPRDYPRMFSSGSHVFQEILDFGPQPDTFAR